MAASMASSVEWNFESYLQSMEQHIKTIAERPVNKEFTFDILDTEKSKQNKYIVLKEKQIQMKIGEIWQKTLGNYNTFEDLGVGHETGLDIRSVPTRRIGELKNRTNTDNAASRKANRDKLTKFKKANPDYECFYGMVNAETSEKTMKGSVKTIMHDGVEIKEYIGMELLRSILGADTDRIIEFVKKMIDNYIYV